MEKWPLRIGSCRGLRGSLRLLLVLAQVQCTEFWSWVERPNTNNCTVNESLCQSGQVCNAQTGSCEPAAEYDGGTVDQSQAAAPALLAVAPARGPSMGGISLLLTGQNFRSGATVTVGGIPSPQVTLGSDASLTVTLPSNPGAFGQVPIIVTNPDGKQASRSDLFAYFASQLAFSSTASFPVNSLPQEVVVGDTNGV